MENGYYTPMPHQPDPYSAQLRQKLMDLEEKVETLQKKLDDTLKTPEIHYHYTFEQLKIEKLEGTLNIGMPSQNDESSIEDFTVEDQTVQGPTAQGPGHNVTMHRDIENELIQYTEQVLTTRKQNDEWVMMPQDMGKMILDDIKQQLPDRVAYYMKQANSGAVSPEEAKAIAFNACKKDIDKALQLFLSNQMNKGAEINEV